MLLIYIYAIVILIIYTTNLEEVGQYADASVGDSIERARAFNPLRRKI